jgi:hypothetical protein
MKLTNFSLLKILLCKKARFFSKKFVESCAFYCLDTEPEPELEP